MLGGAGPFFVVAARFGAGGIVLLPFALGRRPGAREGIATVACSVPLLAGYVLVTVGLQSTTSTAAAFITYLLVVIVPVVSAIILRRLPAAPVAAGVTLATAGLLLLTGGGIGLGRGELLLLGCAFAFSVHVLVLDAVASSSDPIRLAAFQLLVVGAAAAVAAAVFERAPWPDAAGAAGCLVLGALGVGGLVLQIVGQRTVGPTRTSLLLMIEPVLAAVGGYAIGERLSARGFAGAGLILAGIAVSELGRDATTPARRPAS